MNSLGGDAMLQLLALLVTVVRLAAAPYVVSVVWAKRSKRGLGKRLMWYAILMACYLALALAMCLIVGFKSQTCPNADPLFSDFWSGIILLEMFAAICGLFWGVFFVVADVYTWAWTCIVRAMWNFVHKGRFPRLRKVLCLLVVVALFLGQASACISFAAGFYSWAIEFVQARPALQRFLLGMDYTFMALGHRIDAEAAGFVLDLAALAEKLGVPMESFRKPLGRVALSFVDSRRRLEACLDWAEWLFFATPVDCPPSGCG
jgi:hypothetical protein